MDRLEHDKAGVGRRISADRLLNADETGIVKRVQAVEDRERWIRPKADNRLRRIEGPAAGEHRQSPEEGLFRAIEEIMTPGDRSPQRLLSFRAVSATSDEECEAAVKSGQDRFRREQSHPRSRQLDGERETIQATTDGDDRFRVLFCKLEVALHRASAIDEEADRLRGQRSVEVQWTCDGREFQGWHRELILAGDVER
jgi:hypothetical protein